VQISGHTYCGFQVAVIDPNGHAVYTCFATMISEAWRVAEGAEGNVHWCNLKRNAWDLSISRVDINFGNLATVETPEASATTA
jgi:hypothetical protein